MAKKHSNKTKSKISKAVRRVNKVRKAVTQTQKNKLKAAMKFAEGHPDGLEPSAVRNYGDFGRDVIVDNGERENQAPRDMRNTNTMESKAGTPQEMLDGPVGPRPSGITQLQENANKACGSSNAGKPASQQSSPQTSMNNPQSVSQASNQK